MNEHEWINDGQRIRQDQLFRSTFLKPHKFKGKESIHTRKIILRLSKTIFVLAILTHMIHQLAHTYTFISTYKSISIWLLQSS